MPGRMRKAGMVVALAGSLLAASVVLTNAGEKASAEKATETAKLKSGLEEGKVLPAFNPTHVTGPDKGTATCPV